MLDHINEILSRLTGVRQTQESQWEARCPSHDDKRASLSIGVGDDGRALLHCHAGCHLLTVIRALDLRLSDLFPADHPKRNNHRGHIAATYDYRDADGNIVYQVVRFDPKDFRQRQPNGTWGIKGIPRVLYRLPELLASGAGRDWVYIVEGEKDADALVTAGLTATCNAGGAGKWSTLADDSALDGRRVCIIADADGPGRNHASDVASRLHGRAAELRVIELPGAKDAAAWLAAGGTRAALEQLRDSAPGWSPDRKRPQIVQTGAHLRDLVAQSLDALQEANNPPTVFVRCGELVRIVSDENDTPRVDGFNRSSLRIQLCHTADFFVLRKVKDDWEESVSEPRPTLIDSLLSLGKWDLPSLGGITRAPILRPDGTICTVPGYDPHTQLYYHPNSAVGMIPEHPCTEDVDVAVDVILAIIADFPFADQASRANAIGLLLTLLMRSVIHGHVPMAVIDAPTQGTGKSLLVMALATIALGAIAGESVPGNMHDPDEWRKKITSILLRGLPFVLLDNFPDGTAIDSPALASVLTSHEWSDRRLGSSDSITLPARAIWAATGNNLRIEGDMPRRCYLIRLDANVEQPWSRTAFKIPDLLRHVVDNRPQLLAAAFTVVRGWYAAGRPAASVPRLGSFENWAETIGSVLAYAGVDEFLGNMDQVVQGRDEERSQWGAFFDAWGYEFGDEWVTTAEVCERIAMNNNHDAAIPDQIIAVRDRGTGAARRSIGRALSRLTGRVFDGRKLVSMVDSKRHVRRWQLNGAIQDEGALEARHERELF